MVDVVVILLTSEAITIIFNQLDALEKIKEMWKRISKDTSPSVCLLVDVCQGESPYQQEALEWCIESGIELVEWNIDKKTENSTDENKEEGMYTDQKMRSSSANDQRITFKCSGFNHCVCTGG